MWFVGSEKPCIYSVPNRKQSYDEVAVQVVKAYDDLRKLCGMKNIKELGAEESYVDEIIENLKADKNLAYNPCPPKMDVLQKVLHEIYAL